MLGLKVPTDAAWVAAALRDIDGVLVDHAHCEMKAASNALSLATRPSADTALALALTDLAREEIDHFQRVLSLLSARGVPLGPPSVDAYAAELRSAAKSVAPDTQLPPVVDRLLIGALIEARSCERFKLLAAATAHAAEHAAPHALWSELFEAEALHYGTFVDLATRCAGGNRPRVCARLERLADFEGMIVATLARAGDGTRATMHG
jgi:tRNA-(ms[2]io[6]A)-hydroxylase